jgi:hypothetical protein
MGWVFAWRFEGDAVDRPDNMAVMNEVEWSRLSHAFGAADDLPNILSALSPDPSSKLWGELWGRVCHQGTTYTASPHVLPRLLELAGEWEPKSRVMPITLAASIAASGEFDIRGFEVTIEALHRLARATASSEGLSRSDRVDLASSAIILAGDRFWGQELSELNIGELQGSCPQCEVELYLTIGDAGYFASIDDPVSRPEFVEGIDPCQPDELPGNISWVHQIALDARDEELARRVRCVFGRSVCPGCDVPFTVSEAIQQARLA